MANKYEDQTYNPVLGSMLQLHDLVQGQEPIEIADYLTIPIEGRLMAAGTSVPLLSNQFRNTSTGLIVPDTVTLPHLYDYMGVFITISDYFPPSQQPKKAIMEDLLDTLIESSSVESTLTAILVVRKALDNPADMEHLEHSYLNSLPDDIRIYLTNQIISTTDNRRVFVSRHGILASIRYLILKMDHSGPHHEPNTVSSIMLIHTISHMLYDTYRDEQQSESPGTPPTTLQMEIFQNQIFYRFDGILELLSRTYVLWTRYSRRISRTPISYEVEDILVTATELEILDWVTFGYYLMLLNQETSVDTVWFPKEHLPFGSDGRFEHFLSLVAKDVTDFRELLDGPLYRWSFEVFEDYPLLLDDSHFAIIDSMNLIDRVTSGLYWYVHDYIKTGRDRGRLTRWTQSYAEMIEYYAIDLVIEMAPHGLGYAEVIYFEDGLVSEYNCKVCDVVIDYGDVFCAVEVVSGRVTRPARFDGDIGALDANTERLVMKKVRQLHEISFALISQESVLTKMPPVSGRTIVPILVTDYPINPFVRRDLQNRSTKEGLLRDNRIAPLSVIDLGELEQLESILSSGGPDLPTFLREWHDSSLVDGPLMTYLRSRYGFGAERKTLSMREVDISEMFRERIAEAQMPTD